MSEEEKSFLTNMQGTPDITFEHLYEDYIDDCSHRLRETTVAGKIFLIDTKILPFFAKVPINEINPRSVRKWQNWLLKQKNKNDDALSQTYIKTINNQLSAIFNYAVKFYDLKDNPLHKTSSIGKKHAEDMDFWTLNEFERAMTYFKPEKPKQYEYLTIFNLLFCSGMRRGELLALTLNDFYDKSVHINKSYTRLNKKDIISEPKTPKSKREI